MGPTLHEGQNDIWVQDENNSSILCRSSTTVQFYIRKDLTKFYTEKPVLLIELLLRELAVVFPVKKHACRQCG